MTQTGNSTDTTAPAPDHEVQHQRARVALKRGDRFLLLESHNDATQSGDQVMGQIRRDYDFAVAQKRSRCLPCSLFRKPAVYVGTISTLINHPTKVRFSDHNNSSPVSDEPREHEVAFSNLSYSAALTAAFSRPDILRGTGPFAAQYPDTIAGAALPMTNAVVIVSKINKPAVSYLAALTLLLAIAAGLVLGFSTSSVQNGIGCFIGISTIFSVLIGILHWVTK
ncbi:hypothetical protein MFIFM68171_10427 [Madurella fahalii]|uniref:Uncharacterized protein n=1 Tax=Madurella fahalii TaxID=1157608 RepID=A0ABQ0GR67_9PEZI